MTRGAACVALAFALIPTSATAARDELCARLDRFERAAAREAKPQWIEVHWNFDRSSIFSIACMHQKDGAGRQLCAWLPKHVSWEFAGLLPKRIGACYGEPTDRFGVGKFPEETNRFRAKSGGYLTMETHAGDTEPLPWLRLDFQGRGE